jgi:hypothetical protein
MKKLLLLFLLAFSVSFIVQAIPAPDRDVGCVSYVMPNDQTAISTVGIMPVQPIMLFEQATRAVQPMTVIAHKQNQCILSVITPYKGPMIANSMLTYPTLYRAHFT